MCGNVSPCSEHRQNSFPPFLFGGIIANSSHEAECSQPSYSPCQLFKSAQQHETLTEVVMEGAACSVTASETPRNRRGARG